MESYILLLLALCLFTTTFFITTFIIPSKLIIAKERAMAIIPAVGIVIMMTQRIFMSHITAFKLSIFFYLLFILIYKLIAIKQTKIPSYAYALLGALIIAVILPHTQNLPVLYFNLSNTILSGAIFAISLFFYKQNETKIQKELLEIAVIEFIGILMLSFSSSYYLIAIAIGVLSLYQIALIVVMAKFDIDYRKGQEKRLHELENRFNRSVEFEAKKRTSAMADKVEHIREKSQRDPMTKALNRHGLTSEINNLIRDPSVKIFSIAIFDIDFFKSINDTKGHIVGDECLKFLSYSFMVNNRKTDMLGRYGGDEFILIMPHMNAPGALEICERMRELIHKKSTPTFSISMGVATYPYDGRAFTALLEVADKGLYLAKEGGRNQVGYDGNVFIKSEKS